MFLTCFSGGICCFFVVPQRLAGCCCGRGGLCPLLGQYTKKNNSLCGSLPAIVTRKKSRMCMTLPSPKSYGVVRQHMLYKDTPCKHHQPFSCENYLVIFVLVDRSHLRFVVLPQKSLCPNGRDLQRVAQLRIFFAYVFLIAFP